MAHKRSENFPPPPATLDESVVARLRGVAARLRLYVLVEGIARVVAFLFLAALVQFCLDYATRGLRWSMRAAMLAAVVAGALWFVWRRIIAPLRIRFGPAEVANLIERLNPELCSFLISAVRFSAGEAGPVSTNSPDLMAAVIKSSGPKVRAIDFNAVLDPRRSRWAVVSLAVVLILALSAAAAAPDEVGRWFARNVLLQEVEWPRRTRLIVDIEGDELIGARGDDLIVQARAEGVQPRVVDFIFETASGERGRETMVTVGSEETFRYRYTFKNAQEDFDFYLEGGDDRTRTIHAHLLERPRVTGTQMRIVPPPYTGLETVELGDGQRAAQVLPGSVVTIWIETNKPISHATLLAGNDQVAAAEPDGDRHRVTFSPTETHTYHFAMVDDVGLDNRNPVRFSIRVMPDEAPRVRMRLPGVGEMITEAAVLPVKVEFSDTYGLATAELVYQISRPDTGEGLILLPSFSPSMTTYATSVAWPVASAGPVPGETVSLLARATDFDDVSGPNSAQTPQMTLRVVTRDELLAELARREQEFRADFERLVDSQEQLRGALLTVLGGFQSGRGEDALAAELGPLERRQRNIAGSVNVIRQQFEQILAELKVNQLDTLDERRRLGEKIIEPLSGLAKRDLVLAADTIRRWSREASAEIAGQVDPQQVAVLSQMRMVLANMIQWEGYQEAVNMLRDIIRLQQELHKETKEAVEEQANEAFED